MKRANFKKLIVTRETLESHPSLTCSTEGDATCEKPTGSTQCPQMKLDRGHRGLQA